MKAKTGLIPAWISIFFLVSKGFAQQPAPVSQPGIKDTSRMVRLISSDKYRLVKGDSLGELHQLVGHVVLQQGKTIFSCDSAIQDTRLNQVEAFGNIHINDADSVHTYSQYLKYLGDKKTAILKKKVSLTDGKGVLTTEELEYDLNVKIGTYLSGGKVVNGNSVLTSQEGYYYADAREVYFKKNVKLVDPEYTMASDTLLYNIDQELATFVAATTINDGKSTIRTRSGFYDLKEGKASFGQRPIIEDSTQQIIANRIDYDKKSGEGYAEGNVIYQDTTQGMTILAGRTNFNSNNKHVLATEKPVMIVKQDKDSLFVAADTLLSAFALDSIETSRDSVSAISSANSTDTLAGVTVLTEKKAESIRFFQAFHHVKIFSDSLQGVCDSLYYSAKDSIFRFYTNPVLWSGDSQVSGDTIYLLTKNKKADQVFVFENGFSINRTPEAFYNQIRGNRLNGYFRDGNIDYMRAKGNAESVYYLRDDDSAYIGMNYAKADAISMYFKNRTLDKVTWVSGVEGTTYPLKQIPDDKKELRNFKWQDLRRPKTRLELFGN